MGKPPAKKVTEAEALVMIAEALDRIADAAEILASPQPEPKKDEETDDQASADHHND